MTNGHPTREEDFDLYVLGALDADEKRAIESHLAACADCGRKLATARGRVAAISFAAPRRSAPNRKQRHLLRARRWIPQKLRVATLHRLNLRAASPGAGSLQFSRPRASRC
jgi:anti-sigma factor RsiW